MLYKHIEIDRHGGPEVMRLVEDELPEPGDREVRLKVLATVAAFTDGLIREGFYPGLPKPPFSLGYVVIATIDKLGSGVVGLELGQRVVALTVTGGYSEYLCFPGIELVSVPPDVDSAEAVCLVLQYVTAYQLLHRVAKVKPQNSHSQCGWWSRHGSTRVRTIARSRDVRNCFPTQTRVGAATRWHSDRLSTRRFWTACARND